MADPLTMGAISIGSTVLGGINSAAGAARSGAASSKSYMYQAGVSLLNAQIAEQNANYATYQGEKNALQYGLKAGQVKGQILAAQGAGNLDINSGSNKEIQKSQDVVTKMDTDTIRENAAKTAYNFRVEAEEQRTNALMGVQASRDASRAGNMNVAASLIGAAGSVADKWYRGYNSGMFNFGV